MSAQKGVVDRVRAAYWDFSASMREVLAARPSEATLLSLVMVAAFIGFTGAFMQLVVEERARGGAFDEVFEGRVAAAFVGRLFFLPIGLYLLAMAARAAARAYGGTGDWYETRAAFAWALAVATPMLLGAEMLEAVAVAMAPAAAVGDDALAVWRAGGPEAWAAAAAALGLKLAALYVLCACLAAAHGFASGARVMATILGVGAVALGTPALLGQLG